MGRHHERAKEPTQLPAVRGGRCGGAGDRAVERLRPDRTLEPDQPRGDRRGQPRRCQRVAGLRVDAGRRAAGRRVRLLRLAAHRVRGQGERALRRELLPAAGRLARRARARGRRRRDHQHARPLARSTGVSRGPGEEGHVRREAAGRRAGVGVEAARSRRREGGRVPVRDAAAVVERVHARGRARPQRLHRQGHARRRLVLRPEDAGHLRAGVRGALQGRRDRARAGGPRLRDVDRPRADEAVHEVALHRVGLVPHLRLCPRLHRGLGRAPAGHRAVGARDGPHEPGLLRGQGRDSRRAGCSTPSTTGT